MKVADLYLELSGEDGSLEVVVLVPDGKGGDDELEIASARWEHSDPPRLILETA